MTIKTADGYWFSFGRADALGLGTLEVYLFDRLIGETTCGDEEVSAVFDAIVSEHRRTSASQWKPTKEAKGQDQCHS